MMRVGKGIDGFKTGAPGRLWRSSVRSGSNHEMFDGLILQSIRVLKRAVQKFLENEGIVRLHLKTRHRQQIGAIVYESRRHRDRA